MVHRWVIVATALALSLMAGCAGDRTGEERAPRRPTEDRAVYTYRAPRIVGRLQVPELTELSGLAASVRNPGRLWAHNDSGGEPILYCVTIEGAACGRVRLDGATSVDCEDIAIRQQGDAGVLYVADIGDNERTRDFVTIHRLDEPASAAGTVRPESFDLSFPRRPHDAEAIIVEPETEDLYLVTKDLAGRPDVFVARGPLGSATTLEPVGSIRLVGPIAVVTGASLAPTGDRIVLSTYASGYELTLPPGEEFDSIWGQEPDRIDLGSHAQGEAVAYLRSGTIISGSEGAGTPLYAVEYLARP